MSAGAASALAFGSGVVAAGMATPVAIRLAQRLRFYDRPAGYKQHGRPTPYLGGLAVFVGLLIAVASTGTTDSRHLPIVLGTAAVWALGTLDDRWNLPPLLRVAIEAGLGVWLWAAGLGWDLVASDLLNLVFTVGWVVLVVNACNLMDNMDGAGATTGAIAAAGLGVLAIVEHQPTLAAITFALAGALTGFAPANLGRPSRIFLGDGGSMVIGFVIASTAMSIVPSARLGFGSVLCAALLVGLPLLDTTMVVFSRLRRGEPVLTGSRDHLTHRLVGRLHSAHAVCLAMGAIGATLAASALVAEHFGKQAVLWTFAIWAVVAICAIAALERSHRTQRERRQVTPTAQLGERA